MAKWWYVMLHIITLYHIRLLEDGWRERVREREVDFSHAGLEEANIHVINCLWRELHGRELWVACNVWGGLQQPIRNRGSQSYKHKKINSTNNLRNLGSRSLSSRFSDESAVVKDTCIDTWSRESAVLGVLINGNCKVIKMYYYFF